MKTITLGFAGLSLIGFLACAVLSVSGVLHWAVWIPGMVGCVGVFGTSAIIAKNLEPKR